MEFFKDTMLRQTIDENICGVGDLERITAKVATGRVTPREMVQLKNALLAMKPIKEVCAASSNATLSLMAEKIDDCDIHRGVNFFAGHRQKGIASSDALIDVINNGDKFPQPLCRRMVDFALKQKKEDDCTAVAFHIFKSA